MVVLWIIFGLSYLSMTLNYIGRGYKKVERSEVIHSMHSSLVHLSEPFLRSKPKITIDLSQSEDEETPRSKKLKDNETNFIELDRLSVLSEQKAHHSRRDKNTSVLPYIE